MIHLYYGDGKGKTTAATGLLLRAAGHGRPCAMVQFLKDKASGEVVALEQLPGIRTFRGKGGKGFVSSMNDDEKRRTREIHDRNLQAALALVEARQCELLVLDEYLDAVRLELVDSAPLLPLLRSCPAWLEIVITGHCLIPWLEERADYITCMEKRKHPYDRGITARKGVEY